MRNTQQGRYIWLWQKGECRLSAQEFKIWSVLLFDQQYRISVIVLWYNSSESPASHMVKSTQHTTENFRNSLVWNSLLLTPLILLPHLKAQKWKIINWNPYQGWRSRGPASVSRQASRSIFNGLGLDCPCLGLGGPGFVYRVSRTGLGLEAGLET